MKTYKFTVEKAFWKVIELEIRARSAVQARELARQQAQDDIDWDEVEDMSECPYADVHEELIEWNMFL